MHARQRPATTTINFLVVLIHLLGLNAGLVVRDLDVQLLGSFDNGDAVPRADVVRNFGGVGLIMHEQQFQLPHVGDEKFLEPIRHQMTGLSIRAVTNLRHRELTLKPAAHAIVNTFGFPP